MSLDPDSIAIPSGNPQRRMRGLTLPRAVAVLAAWLMTLPAQAGPGEVAIWCAPALKGVVTELASQYERESGHAAIVKSGTVEQLQSRTNAGEPPDVVVFPDEAMEGMLKVGRIDGATRMAFGRVGVGLAVRSGVTAPDISSADLLRSALVKAASIAYPDPREGAGGAVVIDALAKLGIADTVRARSRVVGAGQGATFVGHGDVEIALDQATEILARPGVSFIGLLPANLQRWSTYSAAVSADATNVQDARPFLQFLAGKLAQEKLRAAGFEPAR